MRDWDILSKHDDGTILQKLVQHGYQHPSEVQIKAIPPLLNNKDVVAISTTGSGKTLAFVIPTIILIKKNVKRLKPHMTCALVISPTRELAIQTHQVFQQFIEPNHISLGLLIGGRNQILVDTYLQHGANILISTPGILENILSSQDKNHDLRNILINSLRFMEILILDEADRLLELGFDRQISIILSFIPKQRRTGLFSATESDQLRKLAKFSLRNEVFIRITDKQLPSETNQLPSQLKNYYMICESNHKFDVLLQFLLDNKDSKIIVFTATAFMADYFGLILTKLCKSHHIFILHGKLGKKRLFVFNSFKNSPSGVLVCSDLVSRGIDIPKVDWIIQYEPPTKSNIFLHRSGRTARHGQSGSVLTFLYPHEFDYIEFLKIHTQVTLSPLDLLYQHIPNKLQNMASSDREIYHKGVKAFVSFINFYTQHECRHIFALHLLEVGKIATDFGLLHMPKMPELENANQHGFDRVYLDYSTIKFKDKKREKQRQKILKIKNLHKVKT